LRWVRLKPGARPPSRHPRLCKGEIAHFKIPRHVRLVEEFPMTVTGKMQKFAMRRQMIEALGLTLQVTA
jgi:fatty-acyl-CoA synthase